MELPGGQLAVLVDTGHRLDHSGGPEVGPGELLFTRPDQLHRLAHGTSQSSRLDRGLVGVLAAVAAAGVGNLHADAILGNLESLGELGTRTKRALGSGPDREPISVPFGNRRPRLERGMGDVGDGVDRFDLPVCRRQLILDGTILTRRSVSVTLPARLGIGLEEVGQVPVRAGRPVRAGSRSAEVRPGRESPRIRSERRLRRSHRRARP